jgi:hypothetical protein
MFLAQEIHVQAVPPGGSVPAWYIFAFGGGAVVVLLLLVLLALDRKNRRLHEEKMRALERGLVPQEWMNLFGRDSRRMGWLWLALGLPIFIAFALGIGTFLLVDAQMHSLRDMTAIIVTIWVAGGAVGLAAVIIGGMGMMADQRQQARRPPVLEVSRVAPPHLGTFDDRNPTSEKIRKPEIS